jgi:hypothetical protein
MEDNISCFVVTGLRRDLRFASSLPFLRDYWLSDREIEKIGQYFREKEMPMTSEIAVAFIKQYRDLCPHPDEVVLAKVIEADRSIGREQVWRPLIRHAAEICSTRLRRRVRLIPIR